MQTEKTPAAIGPQTQAAVAEPFAFVSGQQGLDPETGELVDEDLKPQGRQAPEKWRVGEALARERPAAGSFQRA